MREILLCAIIVVLVRISIFDIKENKITNKSCIVFTLFSVLYTLSFENYHISYILISSVTIGSVFCILSMITKGGIGGGDVKFLMGVGILLGIVDTLYAFFVGIIIDAVVVSFWMISGKKKRTDRIPLGPGISIGIICVFIYRILI